MTSDRLRFFPGFVVGAFFLLTVSTVFQNAVFTSPDEVANFTSANAFVDSGSFSFGPVLPGDEKGIVRPRSIQAVGGQLVPLSYLGYPLFLGSVASLTGEFGMRLLTPVLMSLALLAFFRIVEDFSSRRIALVSLVLAASFPTVLFFTYKAFWHNAIFTALVILSVYCFRWANRSRSPWGAAVLGCTLALTLMIRPNEAVWLLPFFTGIAFFSRYRVRLTRLVVAGIFAAALFIPMFVYNAKSFGSPLSFGYTIALEQQATSEQNSPLASAVRRLLLPARPSVEHYRIATEWYTFRQVPLHTIFFCLGLLAFLTTKSGVRLRTLLLASLVPLWLWFYYFGTVYFGYPTNSPEPTIGASYPRYFLPGLFFLLPIVAYGIVSLSSVVRSTKKQTTLLVLGTGVLASLGLLLFLFDKDSGLVKFLRYDVPEHKQARLELAQIPKDAVLIAGRKDKLFFPAHQRVLGYTNLSPQQLSVLPNLLPRYEIYYNDASGRDAPAWESEGLRHGYRLELVGQIGPDPLYHFVKN